MSDLTPEETTIPDWQFAAREEDRIAGAVVAAVDARTAEIVDAIEDLLQSNGHYDMAIEVARRFPNGGTPNAS